MPPAGPLPPSEPDPAAAEAMVAMADGVRLATDLYLPAGRRRSPAVLIRTPYDMRSQDDLIPDIAHRLVAAGYAVVAQDVRGKLRSEGMLEPFAHEAADGHATIDWIAAQRWCDGRVGMIGDSYCGWVQWAAAAAGHPALAAIVPRVTSTRIGTDWVHQGGVFCLAAMTDWSAYTWIDSALYEYERDWSVRPLRDLLPRWLDGRGSPVLDHWRSMPPDHPGWTSGALGRVTPRALRVPALHLGGFWDPFRRGQLADWMELSRTRAAADQYLVLDAIDHDWELFPGDADPAARRPPAGTVDGFLDRYLDPVLPFLERHLRGDAGTAAPAAVRFRPAGGVWSDAPVWPPPGVRELTLWLSGGAAGALAPSPERRRRVATWWHDPGRLVPTLADSIWSPLGDPPDEAPIHGRPDVLTFTAEPAAGELALLGPAEVALDVDGSYLPLQVTAKLTAVSESGRAVRLTEGVRQLASNPGGEPVTIDLGHLGYVLPRGHRLRLEVAGSEFPRFLPVLAPGSEAWSALPGPAAERRLTIGGAGGSRLRLSVLPAAGDS